MHRLRPRAQSTRKTEDLTEHTFKETEATIASRSTRYIYIYETPLLSFPVTLVCMCSIFLPLQEAVLKRPISHIEAWSLGRVRKDPKKGESPYYGKSEEHLTNYKASFIERNPPGVDPIASETDETAMVMSAHGRPHGRSGVLDGVFQPAISYVQLRTSSTGASAANPSRARPSRSKEEEVSISPFILVHTFLSFMVMLIRFIVSNCRPTLGMSKLIVKSSLNMKPNGFESRSTVPNNCRLVSFHHL